MNLSLLCTLHGPPPSICDQHVNHISTRLGLPHSFLRHVIQDPGGRGAQCAGADLVGHGDMQVAETSRHCSLTSRPHTLRRCANARHNGRITGGIVATGRIAAASRRTVAVGTSGVYVCFLLLFYVRGNKRQSTPPSRLPPLRWSTTGRCLLIPCRVDYL